MTTTAKSTALAVLQPAFTEPERLALADFLARYRGLTRKACPFGLRQFTAWCRTRSLSLFAVRRADIETFAREARGRARATVTRRRCAIAGAASTPSRKNYPSSPRPRVRCPRLDYESRTTGLDRSEPRAIFVAVGLGPPVEHALISLLALNGPGV